jgi:uncharacterized 2Fe-2S/4Fe-4S cluster protein (DUF4445 family)
MPDRLYETKILPSGLIIHTNDDDTIFEVLSKNKIPIEGVCGGKGLCGKCAIRIVKGRLSPMTKQEEKWLKIIGLDYRLACQARTLSDTEIELNQQSRTSRTQILVWGQEVKSKLRPIITKQRKILKKPSLKDQEADLNRLLNSLGINQYDSLIPMKVSNTLWKADFDVDIILFDQELINLCPHTKKCHLYGIAFDIGTTTVVGYLYDLEDGKLLAIKSYYNEQIKFGEDVISRIEFANKSEKNLSKIQSAIIGTINRIISELLEEAKIDFENIYDVVCSGNTVMCSFLLGNSAYYSSRVPYIPPFTLPMTSKTRDLKIISNKSAYLRTLPAISAYVGGDLVADILVSKIYEYNEPAALVDLGTNGEVVIKTSDNFLASSCAAGPALEGYSIRNGMRAMEGAIESVSIREDNEEVFFRTIGGIKPLGICGSGIVEALAWMRIRGIVDRTGRIVKGSSKKVIKENGELQFVLFEEKGKKIAITQNDVRKLQVAKAAIFSTLLTLTKLSKVEVKDFKKLFIAGAFGTYVEPFYGAVIGLLPELPKEKYVQIGNGSGAGATALLLSKDEWKKADNIAKQVKTIELNLVKFFKDEFINATFIPHKEEKLFENTLNSIKLLG